MENSTTLNTAATTGAKNAATYGFIGFLAIGLVVFLKFFSPTFWREAKKWRDEFLANRAAKKAAKAAAKEATASEC
jgi:hypothetical protein